MSRKMTVKQAAEEFFQGTISPQLIYQECREGRLPHVRIASKIVLDESSLDKWWEKQLQQSVNEEQTFRKPRTEHDAGQIHKFGTLRKIAE